MLLVGKSQREGQCLIEFNNINNNNKVDVFFNQTLSMKQGIIHRLVVHVIIFESMTEPESKSAPHYVTCYTVQILQASVMSD